MLRASRRGIRGALLGFGMLLCASPWGARAQDPLRVDPVKWEGGQLVTMHASWIGQPQLGEVVDAQGKSIRKVPMPPNLQHRISGGNPAYREGAFYWVWRGLTTRETGEFAEEEVLIHRGKAWESHARFQHRKGVVHLYPLDDDRFLGISMFPRIFESLGKSYPFAVLRRNVKEELVVESVMDTGLREPFFNLEGKRNYPSLVGSFMAPNVVSTGESLVFGADLGLFWIFEERSGSLKRLVRLFPGVTDARLKQNDLYPGLFTFQPAPDGSILISSRTEEAVLQAKGTLPRPVVSGKVEPGSPEVQGLVRQQQGWEDFIARQFPHVAWWRLDPKAGKVEGETPPLRVPDRLFSAQAAKDFNWRFKPNGDLHFYSHQEKNPEPTNDQLESLGLGMGKNSPLRVKPTR